MADAPDDDEALKVQDILGNVVAQCQSVVVWPKHFEIVRSGRAKAPEAVAKFRGAFFSPANPTTSANAQLASLKWRTHRSAAAVLLLAPGTASTADRHSLTTSVPSAILDHVGFADLKSLEPERGHDDMLDEPTCRLCRVKQTLARQFLSPFHDREQKWSLLRRVPELKFEGCFESA